jgi:hypothetical protein
MKLPFALLLFVVGCSGSSSAPAVATHDASPASAADAALDDAGNVAPVIDATVPPSDAGAPPVGEDSGAISGDDAGATANDSDSSASDSGASSNPADCGPPTALIDPGPPNFGPTNWTIIGCPGIAEYAAWTLKYCNDDARYLGCQGLDASVYGNPMNQAYCAENAYEMCGAADSTYADGGCQVSVCFVQFYPYCPTGTAPNPDGGSPGNGCVDAGP